MSTDVPVIDGVDIAVYRFPTPAPEADGTLRWDATTAVTVTLHAGGRTGLGWTYSTGAVADIVRDHLAPVVCGSPASDVTAGWEAMRRACRNLGTRDVVAAAVSAVDIAWWDLWARVLDAPLAQVFGRARTTVPLYGSGGFTTLTDDQLADQVEEWRAAGCTAMKIKIGEGWGRCVDRDLARVHRLRTLAGDDVTLMVDANGAYTVGRARRVGAMLDELGVLWFEEPVSSADTGGLASVRAAVGCDVAAGEYAADLDDVRALLPVVDCLQLDVTRCGGYTGWRRGAALAEAHHLQVSGHCAPALHAPVAASVTNLRHVEWFVDHVRLEPRLVDGLPEVRGGSLHLDPSAPGHGMRLAASAATHRVG